MGIFGKKTGFTLAEVLITLGLIGAISALTIPTLAYNYRSRVLEQQFRSTYSDVMQVASMLSRNRGDIGTFANSMDTQTWASTFMTNVVGTPVEDNVTGGKTTTEVIRNLYEKAKTPKGPYLFYPKKQIDIVCNGEVWTDLKGRIWAFHDTQRAICVDVNGVSAPNRFNIDIFIFIPMTSSQVADWIYNDKRHTSDYSGQMVLCDIAHMETYNLYNTSAADVNNKKGKGAILDSCPFNEPLENVAPVLKKQDGTPEKEGKGTSAIGKATTLQDDYWKTYIHYR